MSNVKSMDALSINDNVSVVIQGVLGAAFDYFNKSYNSNISRFMTLILFQRKF